MLTRSRWNVTRLIGSLTILVSCGLATVCGQSDSANADGQPLVRDQIFGAKRIVILGDSITAAGTYAAYFDAWLISQRRESAPQLIVAGLPSETTSGLSEEGHAGGQFLRPDLHERLDRVLALTKPDLVIACYGINCGIYQPYDEERFRRYQAGIRALREKVTQSHATLILMTPPFYDDQRAKSTWSYNEVLDRYSQWLVSERANGWLVLDLHQAMTAEVVRQRMTDPEFTFQPDAVHPNEAGHWFIASQLIRWCGDTETSELASPAEMLKQLHLSDALMSLVQQRVHMLRDAYVGAAGHKRPGIAPGLPVAEAESKAQEITERIQVERKRSADS